MSWPRVEDTGQFLNPLIERSVMQKRSGGPSGILETATIVAMRCSLALAQHPAIVDVANTVYKYARHPRGFLEGMVLNR